jgi:glycosyltransferase involved in cell wall biosynthesis
MSAEVGRAVPPVELTVVIPAFCEAEHIGDVLDTWRSALEALQIDYVLCAYDDGSSDGTLEILQRQARQHPRVEVEGHENRGHGPTILEGYGRARGGWVFQVDSDGEIAPDHFGALWSRREGYDLLLGCRQRSSQPPARRLTSLMSRLVVRVLFGSGIRDVNSPYRLMRGSALRRLLPRIPSGAFAPNVILSGLVIRDGLRVLELDVPVRTRASGRSSLGGARLWAGAWRSLADTVQVARSTGHGS